MNFLIYTFAVLFIGLSFFMFAAYSRTRQTGLLIMAVCYGAGGLVGGYMLSGWPLLFGFLAAWAVRILGLDPDTHAPAAGGDGAAGDKPAGGRGGG